MGGYGSGRWNWHTKATTVEDCRQLDVVRWTWEGIIKPETWRKGGWVWSDARTGEETSSIGYEVDTTDRARPWARLHYTFTQTGEKIDYKIALQTTQPHFGGLRWWFTCPLVVNDTYCGRRVRGRGGELAIFP
jgi:hypothetical protein